MTQPIIKSLDAKVANILADSSCNDFILADAKDADMAGGMAAPGQSPEHHSQDGQFRSLSEYRQLIRDNTRQGLVDIMLMSASNNEVLTINERLFDNTQVTPAIRANDTTDIWLAQGGVYAKHPSRPFRSATIDHGMCGKVNCQPEERHLGADLGLYSVTFNNDIERDVQSLQEYTNFRLEAEAKGFRHFLEVFDPNASGDHQPADVGRYINDQIARALAGVTSKGRPVFLKIAYHGPASMEQIVSYDPTLITGILGGASGTTFDAFFQLWEAKKYGARAALYGRMINNSEHQLSFIQHLRWLGDGHITDPAEAVRSYHCALDKFNIQPYRPLEDDLQDTLRQSSYAGSSSTASIVKPQAATSSTAGNQTQPTGEPDFAAMSTSEKVAWNLNKWTSTLG